MSIEPKCDKRINSFFYFLDKTKLQRVDVFQQIVYSCNVETVNNSINQEKFCNPKNICHNNTEFRRQVNFLYSAFLISRRSSTIPWFSENEIPDPTTCLMT